MPPQRAPWRHVAMHDAGRGVYALLPQSLRCYLGRRAREHNEVFQCRGAGNTRLGHQHAMPADADIVTDLDQVVDLGALADYGIANGTTIDRGTGAISTSSWMMTRPTCGTLR